MTVHVDAPLGELLSTREAAAYLGIRINRLRRAVYQREVRFLKDGGLLGFYRPWLDDWRDVRTTPVALRPRRTSVASSVRSAQSMKAFMPKVRRLSRG